jgi:hypothetical protein
VFCSAAPFYRLNRIQDNNNGGLSENMSIEEIASPIASLKKAALHFGWSSFCSSAPPLALLSDGLDVVIFVSLFVLGALLSQQDSPVIHIRGASSLFSCFDLGNNVSLTLLSLSFFRGVFLR